MTAALSGARHDALLTLLDGLTAPPTDPPPQAPGDLASLISAITARPWRRSAVDAATLADIERKVARAMAAGVPLEFSVPFGGYKGWRLPAFPHIDWAELFWIDYLRRYADRLARLHAPGVIVSLTCLRGVLGWVNNLRPADQDTYLTELTELLDQRSSPRVTLRCVDLTPLCGGSDATLALLAEREAKAPAPTPAQRASAARNLIHAVNEPDNPEWRVAIDRAARRCAVMEGLEPRRTYNKFGPRIQLTHIRGAGLALHLGSCRSAVAQPWVSTGWLEWRPASRDWLERLGAAPPPDLHLLPLPHPLAALSPHLTHIPLAPWGP